MAYGMMNDLVNKYANPQMKTGLPTQPKNPMDVLINKYPQPGQPRTTGPTVPTQQPTGNPTIPMDPRFGVNPGRPSFGGLAVGPTMGMDPLIAKYTGTKAQPDVATTGTNVGAQAGTQATAQTTGFGRRLLNSFKDAGSTLIDKAKDIGSTVADAVQGDGAQTVAQPTGITTDTTVTTTTDPMDSVVKKTLGDFATRVKDPFTEAGRLADEETMKILQGASPTITKMRQDFERRISQRESALMQQARNQAAQMNLPIGGAGYNQLMDQARNQVDQERAQGFDQLSKQAIAEREGARAEGRGIENRVTNLATAERVYADTEKMRDKTDFDNLINNIEDQKTKQALLAAWATSNGDVEAFKKQLPNFIDPKTGELKQPGVSKQGAIFKDAQDKYAYKYYRTSWDDAVKKGLITDPDTEMSTKDSDGDGNPDFQQIYDAVLETEQGPISETQKTANEKKASEKRIQDIIDGKADIKTLQPSDVANLSQDNQKKLVDAGKIHSVDQGKDKGDNWDYLDNIDKSVAENNWKLRNPISSLPVGSIVQKGGKLYILTVPMDTISTGNDNSRIVVKGTPVSGGAEEVLVQSSEFEPEIF